MDTLWQNHIAGSWEQGTTDDRFPLINPATEEVLGHLPLTTSADVRRAIDAASDAFGPWRNTEPRARAAILRKTAQLMRDRIETISAQITREIGKPIAQSRGEVTGSAAYLDWFAGEAERLSGSYMQLRGRAEFGLVSHEPVGVTAGFTAWNFPISLPCRKIGPALAAGCTMILRPAFEGSGVAVMVQQCFVDAGTPDGVVQLLLGDGAEIADVMNADARVRKVSFTGSVPVGKEIIKGSAATVKRLSLELGGHAPVIVFDDVDAFALAKKAGVRKFANAGQICVSPSRFFVQSSVYDAFVAGFKEAADALRIGDPMDPTSDVGPVVNKRRMEALSVMVQGTDAVLLGQGIEACEKGYFLRPAMVTGVTHDHPLMQNEIFGPIAPIASFDTEEEVLDWSNALELGLAGFVFSHNLGRAHRVADRLECGLVGMNTLGFGFPEAPFGGAKQSGYGSEGGPQGMHEYLRPKLTVVHHEI